jgi:hypothetical protein
VPNLGCKWLPLEPDLIQVPLNASLVDILRLRYTYTQELINASGLATRLFEAETRKAKLVARAAQTLEVLGVSLPALDDFVSRCIKNTIRQP